LLGPDAVAVAAAAVSFRRPGLEAMIASGGEWQQPRGGDQAWCVKGAGGARESVALLLQEGEHRTDSLGVHLGDSAITGPAGWEAVASQVLKQGY
jgi:hypothetical protein